MTAQASCFVACGSVRTDLNPSGLAGCRIFDWDGEIRENFVRRENPFLFFVSPYQLYEIKVVAFRILLFSNNIAFYDCFL